MHLAEVCSPVQRSPAVERVLHGQLICAALQERAQRAHVSISARAVNREADIQQLLARKPGLQAHRHQCSAKTLAFRNTWTRESSEKWWTSRCLLLISAPPKQSEEARLDETLALKDRNFTQDQTKPETDRSRNWTEAAHAHYKINPERRPRGSGGW